LAYAPLYWERFVHQDRDVPSFGNVVRVLMYLTLFRTPAANR
jgi:hypothetical protein